MKIRRILLINSFSDNAGDMAIVLTMIKQLHELFPDVQITVSCSNPKVSRKHSSEVTYKHYPLPAFASYPSYTLPQLFKGGLVFCRNMLAAVFWRLSGKRILFNKKGPITDFIDSDLVISVGGGFISSDYGLLRPYHDFILTKLLGKPLVIYGQSLGPFRGTLSRAASAFVLGMADLIIVREEHSKKCLDELDIKDVHVTADLAFAFQAPPKSKRTKRIILCPRMWTREHREAGERYLSFLSTLSKSLLKTGRQVVVLPTAEEDLKFQKLLQGKLPGVTFINQVYSPQKIAQLLAGSEFLISSRLHPIILGSLSGTPFFAIGWEFKLDEVSPALGSESIRADKLDDTAQKRIFKAIENKEKISMLVSENIKEIRQRAQSNVDILRTSLEKWGYT